MHNLSVIQAVTVWSEFERALAGIHSFDGDTAEIYAYRLMPHTPAHAVVMKPGVRTGPTYERASEAWVSAAHSLVALLNFFVRHYEVDGVPTIEATIDGHAPGDWLDSVGLLNHRCHVKIKKRK